MNNRIPITLLTGAPREAEELKRRMRLIQDKPLSLSTHYSASESPAEPTDLPAWADAIDSERRRDSWVGKCIVILMATCAALGLLAFIFA